MIGRKSCMSKEEKFEAETKLQINNAVSLTSLCVDSGLEISSPLVVLWSNL